MLADIKPTTHDFRKLARYLLHGKTRPSPPDRVAWILEQNLGTTDPELAAAFMEATAARSRRCTNACYHLVIAWHAREQPALVHMQAIARPELERAGLAEHQALIMGHGDKAHPHLHMMINRVSPVTGRAWSTAHDYARFDRIMRELAEGSRFAHVPAHCFNPEITDATPRKPNRRATYAARRGADTDRIQWSAREARAFTGHINEKLDLASTWDDLHALFADEGLMLEAKGKGYVVGNAGSYVKLSALGLQPTIQGLIKRWTPARSPPAKRRHTTQPLVDAVDLARAFRTLGLAEAANVRAAIQEAAATRHARLARTPLIVQLLASLRKDLAAWTAHTPPRRRPTSAHPQREATKRRIQPARAPSR